MSVRGLEFREKSIGFKKTLQHPRPGRWSLLAVSWVGLAISPWGTMAQIPSSGLAALLRHKGGTVCGLLESGWVLSLVPGKIAFYMH